MDKPNEEIMKRAVIAGASRALKIKQENPMNSDEKVLKQVVKDLRNIVDGIDKE